jgi:hypothetical protein
VRETAKFLVSVPIVKKTVRETKQRCERQNKGARDKQVRETKNKVRETRCERQNKVRETKQNARQRCETNKICETTTVRDKQNICETTRCETRRCETNKVRDKVRETQGARDNKVRETTRVREETTRVRERGATARFWVREEDSVGVRESVGCERVLGAREIWVLN